LDLGHGDDPLATPVGTTAHLDTRAGLSRSNPWSA